MLYIIITAIENIYIINQTLYFSIRQFLFWIVLDAINADVKYFK